MLEEVQHNGLYRVEFERERDGRWIADVPALAGVMAYGVAPDEAFLKCVVLSLLVLADCIERGELALDQVDLLVARDPLPADPAATC